jgi:PadR family transcriptional regulator AphA
MAAGYWGEWIGATDQSIEPLVGPSYALSQLGSIGVDECDVFGVVHAVPITPLWSLRYSMVEYCQRMPKPTATSFALLGLLGVTSWTAYDLVAQVKRSMHYYWPRSEAHLYAELKRLVERGHVSAELVEGRTRQRTRYTITAEGRAALQDWLGTEPAPPILEVEGLLRMFLADQGTVDDLRKSLEATARQARELHLQGRRFTQDLLDTGGQFSNRLHLVETTVGFFDGFYRLLIDFCDESLANLDEWPDVRDVGLTPQGRERIQRILAKPGP